MSTLLHTRDSVACQADTRISLRTAKNGPSCDTVTWKARHAGQLMRSKLDHGKTLGDLDCCLQPSNQCSGIGTLTWAAAVGSTGL